MHSNLFIACQSLINKTIGCNLFSCNNGSNHGNLYRSVFILNFFVEHKELLLLFTALVLLMQQTVTMVLIMCSKKMAQEKFCMIEASQ